MRRFNRLWTLFTLAAGIITAQITQVPPNTAATVIGSVAINGDITPASAGAYDAGTATMPLRNIYFSGASGTPGTNNFELTGTSTSGTRVVTFQDATGTLPICASYSVSNNGTNFTVNGTAGIAIPAAVTASVVLFALPAKGRVLGVSEKTSTAWSGTGFTSFAETIGDSVGGTTHYNSNSYDLDAAVSNTNFQNSGALFKSGSYAGSNVLAVITANQNLNANTITGVTVIEACWVVLP